MKYFTHNNGELISNKAFTFKVAELINSYFLPKVCVCDGNKILFDKLYYRGLYEALKEIIDQMAPLGYILNGRIDFIGLIEGSIEVKNNEVKMLNVSEATVRWASDDDLISELESRGYTVMKLQNGK